MGALNKAINVLTLIFALAILVLGVSLFSKRYQLMDRGDKMASAIESVSQVLDDKSNTNAPYASDLKDKKDNYFKSEKYPSERLRTVKLELKPKAAGKSGDAVTEDQAEENTKSTLHHSNYNTPGWLLKKRFTGAPVPPQESKGENLKKQMELFIAQAKDIVAQRNKLGDTLKTVADKLCLPETFEQKQFYSVKTFAERDAKLIDLAESVNKRNDLFADALARIGSSLKEPIAEDFKDKSRELKFDELSTTLDKLVGDSEKVMKRSNAFADSIARIAKTLGLAAPTSNELKEKDYAGALTAAENGAKEVKDDLDKTKAELARVKGELEDTRQQLADIEKKHNELGKKHDEANKLIAKLQKLVYGDTTEGEDAQAGKGPKEDGNLYEQLIGQVLEVNKNYDYVVIDLGKNSKFKRVLANGKSQELKAPVPENKEMFVSRGDKYIAKIKLVKVSDSCSIGNIVPGPRGGTIEIGDKVFFPPSPPAAKAEQKADGEAAAPAEGEEAPAAGVDVGMN